MKPLFTGIYNLFKATPANNFYNAVGGRLYLHEAPQGATFPYAVYFLVSGMPEYWLSGPTFEEPVIQFSLFSDSESASEVTDLYTYLTALFDDCTLTVSGYTPIIFERQNYQLLRDPIDGTWHYIVEYDGLFVEGEVVLMADTQFHRATGSAAISSIVNPEVAWQLDSIRLHLSAAGGGGTLTATVDHGTGAVYDVIPFSQNMTTVTDLVWQPERSMEFGASDKVHIEWTNPNSRTYGLEVIWKALSTS